MSLISVIVPVYKVEAYLRKCIDSLLMQTYANIEIILVDDGSPDGSGAICDEYAVKDKRVKVIHKENGGLSDARNAGIDVARGEYIAFVDSDDYVEAYMYESMISAMLEKQADICICNVDYVDEHGVSLEKMNLLSPIRDESGDAAFFLRKLGNEGQSFYVTAWNKLYHKKLFSNIRFPVGKQHEDEFVVHHLMVQSNRICSISIRPYHYLQREKSIMSSGYSVKRLDCVEAMMDRMQLMEKCGAMESSLNTLVIIVYVLSEAQEKLLDPLDIGRINLQKKEAFQLYKELKRKCYVPIKLQIKFALFFGNSKIFRIYLKHQYG